jgi:hypothetical protein
MAYMAVRATCGIVQRLPHRLGPLVCPLNFNGEIRVEAINAATTWKLVLKLHSTAINPLPITLSCLGCVRDEQQRSQTARRSN